MTTSGLAEKFDAAKGLQALLEVPEIDQIHGKLPALDFLSRARDIAAARKKEEIESFPTLYPLSPSYEIWNRCVNIAEQLLEIERQRTPIRFTAADVEPEVFYYPENRTASIFVGHGDGCSYFIGLRNDDSENATLITR